MASFEEYDDRFQYFCHGTNDDNVESFFNTGLMSNRGNSMESTLWPISAEDIEQSGLRLYEEQYCKRYNFKYCYIIKIPKYYMGWMVHRDNSIEVPIPIWIPTEKKDYANRKISILIPHLIAGVYSIERNQIMPNPNYNPKYNPSGLQYADEQIANMLNSANPDYMQWMNFARLRENFGYEELKRKDEAGSVWSSPMQRYSTIITEQYNPRPANIKK